MTPVIFGEVLFDVFEDQTRVLGGAPFNVAWHLQAFGLSPLFVSRVGDDAQGAEVRARMGEWGMTTVGLQTDPQRATGEVLVHIRAGHPSYEIAADRAYDYIAEDELPDIAEGLLYHGTLALRSPRSRGTLEHLRARFDGHVVIDLNLRAPWWERDAVLGWMDGAHTVKLATEELDAVAPGPEPIDVRAAATRERYHLERLVVTMGSQGAMAVTASADAVSQVPPVVDVVDSVGAGDAFTSVLILGTALGWDLPTVLERAGQFAARIVGQRGATSRDRSKYEELAAAWGLADRPSGAKAEK